MGDGERDMGERNGRWSGSSVSRAWLAIAVLAAALLAKSATAEDFYAGKTIKLGVSSDAGGGYDIYTRLLSRYIPRYIPGAPTIIVQNMPGGGGLRAAHNLYSIAAKDGTEFSEIHATTMLDSILGIAGQDIEPTKYAWIGSMASDDDVCSFWHTSGIRSFDDMLNKPTIIGATGKGSQAYTFPTAINNVLHTKMKIVLGYKGTGDRLIALERGEIAGSCGINASTLKSVAQRQIGDGSLVPIVQSGLKPHPSFPNVPLTISYAKTDEQRQVMETIFSQMQIARVFAAPPGVPDDRVRTLRTAFMQSMKDAGLVAEADKLKIDIIPSTGDEVQALIAKLASLPADLKKKVDAAIGD
jgi:tripartite-type tricarboxylate transporter receptor subunit TctC